MDIVLNHVRSILSTTSPRWRAQARMIPVERLAETPAAGKWPAHDLNHTIQAERSLMQPFIRGCGPWRKYFFGQIIER